MKNSNSPLWRYAWFLCILIFAFTLLGCTESNKTRPSDILQIKTPTTVGWTTKLTINEHYWITANPLGNGKFGYFIGVSNQPGGIVSETFNAGTSVVLLEVNTRYCKIKGFPSFEQYPIQGWVYCDRLADFQPTAVPDSLYIHAP